MLELILAFIIGLILSIVIITAVDKYEKNAFKISVTSGIIAGIFLAILLIAMASSPLISALSLLVFTIGELIGVVVMTR